MRLGEVRSEMAKTLSTQLQRQSPLADRRLQDHYDNRVSLQTIEGKQIAVPWVERLPIYKSFGHLSEMKDLVEGDEEWEQFIEFIDRMKSDGVGHPGPIFFDPYKHQAESVSSWWKGNDVSGCGIGN